MNKQEEIDLIDKQIIVLNEQIKEQIQSLEARLVDLEVQKNQLENEIYITIEDEDENKENKSIYQPTNGEKQNPNQSEAIQIQMNSIPALLASVTKRQTLCLHCDRQFASTSNLKAHLKLMLSRGQNHTLSSLTNQNQIYKCDLCDKVYAAKQCLNLHMKLHSGNLPHFCSICSRIFKTRATLNNHFRTSHSNEKKMLKCNECNYETASVQEFYAHLKKHIDNKTKNI